MKLGKFIMNSDHQTVDNAFSWLEKRWGYWKFDRRATDLYDRGGLVAFRDRFVVSDKVKSVKLAVTALGVFEVYINGKRVGNDEMKPGWTDYRFRVFEFD